MSLRIPRSAPSFPTLGLTLAAHPSFPTLDLTTSEGRGSGNGNGESSPFPAAWISTMAISRAPFPTVTLKNGFLYIAIPFMCMVFSAGSTPWLNKLLIHVKDRLAANGFCVFQRQLVGLSSIPINGRREANQSNCTLHGLLIMLGARFFFQHSDSEQIFSFLSPNLHCNVYQNGTRSYLCIFFKEQSSYCL